MIVFRSHSKDIATNFNESEDSCGSEETSDDEEKNYWDAANYDNSDNYCSEHSGDNNDDHSICLEFENNNIETNVSKKYDEMTYVASSSDDNTRRYWSRRKIHSR